MSLVVRDSVAAANGRDLPKYLDATKVRTMTVGRSAERGKPLLRQGQTRERGTRKAKIEGDRPTATVFAYCTKLTVYAYLGVEIPHRNLPGIPWLARLVLG
jgi:hypothetical protein